MTIDPSVQPGAFEGRRPIGQEELLRLRHNVWADGNVSPPEAAELFELNAQAQPSNDWTDFFVEALCDYLIARGEPRGYVTNSDADWLMAHIDKDGRVETHAELELIVKLFERAESVPQSLKQFALAQIEQTVVSGSGPTRGGGEVRPGCITAAEAQILRRLIFSPAGDGPAHVSRAEADMLFRLKDATLGAENAPDWQRLFVQGVANHLMAHQSYVPLDRETASRFDDLRAPRRPFGELASEFARDPGHALFGRSEEERVAEHDEAVARDSEVTSDEADWLTRLIERDGARDPLEQALLDFLAEERGRAL